MKLSRICAIVTLLSLAFAVGFAKAAVIKKETVKTEISQKQDLTVEVIKLIEIESSALCLHYAAIAPGIFTIEVPEIGYANTEAAPGSIKVRCSFANVPRGPPKT